MASTKSSATGISDASTKPNDLQSGNWGESDSVTIPITIDKLSGNNYFQWSLSMWMFICEKGKENYLSDGSVPPDEGSSDICQWKSENDLVMTWLVNSMAAEISEDFLLYQTASEIWLAVKEMFFIRKETTSKIFEIEASLQDLKQGKLTVVQYYNQLSRKWQKLDMFDVREWHCPEDAKIFKEIVDEKRLFQFLMGLNKELDAVTVRLLGSKTLPKLRAAFSEVRQEESRMTLSSSTPLERPALTVKRNPQDNLENKAKKGKGWCDHCKRTRSFAADRKPSKPFAERENKENQDKSEEEKNKKTSPFSEEQLKALKMLAEKHLADHNSTTSVPQTGFTFTEVNSIRASPNKVGCCHFSSDGKLLASGGHDKKAVVWFTETLKPKTTLEEHSMIITDVRFSPSMARLATSSFDKTVRVWDADNSGYSLRTFTGHSDGVMSLDFHPNKDDLICSCDGDSEIRYWSINNGSCARVFKGGSHQVRFQPRHGRCLAAAAENVVSILDVETQACRQTLKGHTKAIHSICWDPSGELLASVSEDSVRVWSLGAGSEGECVHELSCNGNKFHSCAFHPSYSTLLVIGCYQSLELWNMSENKTMTLSAHDGLVAALAVSPVAGLVASASHDKMVKLWK